MTYDNDGGPPNWNYKFHYKDNIIGSLIRDEEAGFGT